LGAQISLPLSRTGGVDFAADFVILGFLFESSRLGFGEDQSLLGDLEL
jgi:hypothetical protein